MRSEVEEEGFMVKVSYQWPDILCSANNLFKKVIAKDKLPDWHPILDKADKYINEIRHDDHNPPRCSFRLELPFQVHCENERVISIVQSLDEHTKVAQIICHAVQDDDNEEIEMREEI